MMCTQVTIIGNEGSIDMVPSSIWLRENTALWPWKTHIVVGPAAKTLSPTAHTPYILHIVP